MAQPAEHDHSSVFISESFVQARVCRVCGAYVNAQMLMLHVGTHEPLESKSEQGQLPLFP